MKKIFILLILIVVFLISSSINIYAINDKQLILIDDDEIAIGDNVNEASSRSVDGGSEINGEIWYGIDLDDDGNPIITYNINYGDSNLLKYVKPGDIVYEQNAGVDIVDYVGHSALVVDVVQATPTQPGYILLIESMPNVANPYTGESRNLGVCYALMTPTRFTEKYVTIMRVNDATNEQIQGAINFAKSKIAGNWTFKIYKDIDGNAKNWYCSELIWAAYYHQDILLEPNDGTIVRPAEIYESNAVSTILRYNSPTTFSEVTATHHTYSCDGDTYTEAHEFEAYNSCYEKCRMCDYKRQIKNHDYTYRYSYSSSSVHRAYCECNEYIELNHNFKAYLPCSEKCADCGYKNVIGEHDYTYEYDYYSATQHQAYCECGASELNDHVYEIETEGQLKLDVCIYCKLERNHEHSYTYTSCKDGKTHYVYCWCGVSKYEQCFGMVGDGDLGLVRCSKCNQRLSGNIISPLNEDEDGFMIFKKDNSEEAE